MRSAIPVVVALVGCFCAAPALAQPPSPFVNLSLDPASQTVDLGDTADVVIGISGLADFAPRALGAFDLGLGFDPAILSLNTVVFGDQVAGSRFSGAVGAGRLDHGFRPLHSRYADHFRVVAGAGPPVGSTSAWRI